ncbi:MAG: DMT family transporter [Candidatus Rokuibacteriota bacterium]|nr:MAG: DMT family transporter [Candidatus Rokubacteria bacterium]
MPALSQTRAYAALLLIATLWGTFPATGKLAVQDFPPVFLTALRAVIASTFLVVLLLRSGAETIRGLGPGSIRAFVVLGVCGLVLSTQLSYVGYAYTTAANAAILQAATPVLVALGARAYLGERLRRRQQAGVAVSALGVLVVVTDGRLWALRLEDLRSGDFITLAGLVAWMTYTVYGKRVVSTHSPALTTTAAYVAGTCILVAEAVLTAPLFPRPVLTSTRAWIVVVYHALLGAVAHIWWYRAVDRVGASRAAVFMNVTPIVGVALAAALLHEPIGIWEVVGTLLVLAGVALTTTKMGAADGRPAADSR